MLAEVTIVPSPNNNNGGSGGTKPNAAGAAGGPTAVVAGSPGQGLGGDPQSSGGTDAQPSGGSDSETPGAGGQAGAPSQAGGTGAGGDPSTGGQPMGGEGGGGTNGSDLRSGPFKVLVVAATDGFTHGSIPEAVTMVQELGQTADANLPSGAQPGSQFTVTVLNTPTQIESMLPDYLADYELLFFAHPTGQLFSSRPNGAEVMDAVESFMTNGGGWVGINGAIDMEVTGAWPWYQDNLTGSRYNSHTSGDGNVAWASAAVTADHPVIRGLPSPWARDDEWYNLARNPANVGFSILGTLAAPDLRPVVWSKEIGAEGRALCTSLGQDDEPFAEAPFRRFMLQSILWAVHRIQ